MAFAFPTLTTNRIYVGFDRQLTALDTSDNLVELTVELTVEQTVVTDIIERLFCFLYSKLKF